MKLILDIDTGIDDALAIAYALASPEAELIGVVGTFGNVITDDAIKNSKNLLNMLGASNVPVYKGATKPLLLNNFEVCPISKVIHGKDGIGELYLNDTQATGGNKDGIDFILESAEKYGEELMIVATGPMTDLAEAILKDASFKDFSGGIVIMGGAVTVPGNAGPLAEANISQDPKAAQVLFDSNLKITMVGLDVTLRTLMTKQDTAIWRSLNTTSAKAYADMVDFYIDAYKKTSPHLGGCALHDPLAVAVAMDPNLVQTLPLYLKVGQGFEEINSGQTTGDEKKLSKENPNIKVCIGVDVEKFTALFMDRLGQLFCKH